MLRFGPSDAPPLGAQGGDCHLGRAFLLPASDPNVAGRGCVLTRKGAGGGESTCASSASSIALNRSRPLSVASVVSALSRVAYRSDEALPSFANGVQEVSFGQLYAPSVAEALASDLRGACALSPLCALKGGVWGGGVDFLDNYTRGAYAAGPSPAEDPAPLNASVEARLVTQVAARKATLVAWQANWTWSFSNTSAPPVPGGFTRAAWASDRGGVCRESLLRYLATAPPGASIRNISLCNPPPTAALAQLCSTLITARQVSAAYLRLHSLAPLMLPCLRAGGRAPELPAVRLVRREPHAVLPAVPVDPHEQRVRRTDRDTVLP